MSRRTKDSSRHRSLDDNDVESHGHWEVTSPLVDNSGDRRADIFMLKGLIQKIWPQLEDINYCICQETADFVVANKPVFDVEKLTLVKITNFIEADLTCGTFSKLKKRKTYDGPLLNSKTFSTDWNRAAEQANSILIAINKEITVEATMKRMQNHGKEDGVLPADCAVYWTPKRVTQSIILFFAAIGFLFTMYVIGYAIQSSRYGGIVITLLVLLAIGSGMLYVYLNHRAWVDRMIAEAKLKVSTLIEHARSQLDN